MQGVTLVTTPAPNSVTTASSGWWLSAAPRPGMSMRKSSMRHGRPNRVGLHAPPRAILRAHVLRRDLGVGDFAGVRVDLEDLGGAHRQIAQQDHLGERARMAGEVRAGRRAALARRDPLGVDALEARVLLRRRVGDDLRLTGFVQQSRLLTVDPSHELSLVPDPQLAAGIERPRGGVGDLLGARRIQAAVPPHDFYFGSIALRREGVGDARARGRAPGFWMRVCLPIFIAMIPTTVCVWSGVETVTASMFLPSFSSIARKSLKRLALGNVVKAAAAC